VRIMRNVVGQAVNLTKEEMEIYDRQIRITGFGIEGQKKLKSKRALVIGIGGLGSIIATYLTVAGVGKIILVDRDKVELTNMNRQILYNIDDVGKAKARVAAEKLRRMNPYVDVEGVVEEINEDNIDDYVKSVDIVLDGLDNFRTRLLVNDACVRYRRPFIHGAVSGFNGQVMDIIPFKGPCLRCVVPKEPQEESKVVPVIGVTSALVGSIEALEAIKLMTGIGEPLVGYFLVINGLHMRFKTFKVIRRPNCPACGKGISK